MANDIKITFDPEKISGDFSLSSGGGDLKRELGLETAVLLSLFTDRRADDSDVFDGEDKRGWWADQLNQDEYEIGSKLWLLDRSKTTPQTLVKAREYCLEALEWMIDEEVVAAIEVEVERENSILKFKTILYKADGKTEVFKFDDLWRNL